MLCFGMAPPITSGAGYLPDYPNPAPDLLFQEHFCIPESPRFHRAIVHLPVAPQMHCLLGSQLQVVPPKVDVCVELRESRMVCEKPLGKLIRLAWGGEMLQHLHAKEVS